MQPSSAELPTTVEAALRWATARLRPVTDRPRLEAEILLSSLLHIERVHLFAHPERQLTAEERHRYAAQITQRARAIPLPYLTGEVEFYGLRFSVDERVLIPRPETELLVEQALSWLKGHPRACGVDVGTGSGCIAAAIAYHQPGVQLYAIDLSAEALQVARTNLHRLGLTERVHCVQADLLTAWGPRLDFIVSNPPYVAADEWETLPPSVRHEPRIALLGGNDGLAIIRLLLLQARRRLRHGGMLLVEIGEREGEAVLDLAQLLFPTSQVEIIPDLAGRPRLLRLERDTQVSKR